MFGRVEKVFVNTDAKNATGENPTDREGNVLNGIDQVLEYGYNVKGEQISLLRDNNVDGKYDYREVYTLNANGGRIAKEIDLTNDGQFDKKEVYTKEADDGLVKTEFYNLVDGREVLTKVEDYTLNTNNQRTSVKVDTLGDGTTDAVTRYELDSLGRMTKAYIDTDGDNQVDRAETYTRDSNGNITKTETDLENNDTIDSVTYYDRNALGQVLKESADSDNNDVIDAVRHYELDIYGNRLKESYYVGDNGSTLAAITERKFNELNQEIERYFDRTGDGLTTDDTIYHYTRDQYGRVESTTSVNALTKDINSITYNTYDATGQQISSKVDNGGDGIIDSNILFEYDNAIGVINKRIYMDPTTDKISYTLEHEFNPKGTTLITYRDNLGDGTIERLEFGSFGGQYTTNHTEDFTVWNTDKLEKINGLNQIVLSSASYETTIKLDSSTLAAISPAGRIGGLSSSMSINGDTTDTVNLSSDFEKLSTSRNLGANTFDMYSTKVGETTYTLYIDNDIQTVIG